MQGYRGRGLHVCIESFRFSINSLSWMLPSSCCDTAQQSHSCPGPSSLNLLLFSSSYQHLQWPTAGGSLGSNPLTASLQQQLTNSQSAHSHIQGMHQATCSRLRPVQQKQTSKQGTNLMRPSTAAAAPAPNTVAAPGAVCLCFFCCVTSRILLKTACEPLDHTCRMRHYHNQQGRQRQRQQQV